MLRWQQQQPQLDNAMAYQQPTGVAVQILTNAIREGVIVIWIHIVLDVWLVGIIIATEIFRPQQVIGPVVQIAARVWQTIEYFFELRIHPIHIISLFQNRLYIYGTHANNQNCSWLMQWCPHYRLELLFIFKSMWFRRRGLWYRFALCWQANMG